MKMEGLLVHYFAEKLRRRARPMCRCMTVLIFLAAAWTGCTGPEEDEGWVKHTASPGEQEARRQREEQERADVEARRMQQEELLAAIETERDGEMEAYSNMLAADPLMLERRLGLDEAQKKPVLDIIHQSMLDKRAVYRKYGGEVDLRMKGEVQEIDTRTETELSGYLASAQLREYKMVIDEMRRGFYARMQPVVEEEEDDDSVIPPEQGVFWQSIPRVWPRRNRR